MVHFSVLLPIVVEDETRQKQSRYFYNGVKMCPAQAKQRQMCDEKLRLHTWNFQGKKSNNFIHFSGYKVINFT